jgi:hypothetical protein
VSATDAALAVRLQAMRLDLQAQRTVLASRLDPAAAIGFPRSMLMRLLIQRPDLAGRTLLDLALLVQRSMAKPRS